MWYRTEEEVDIMIDEMISRTKGNYITQAVAFNKNSKSQLELLKSVLLSSYSFGGYVKGLIGEKMTTPHQSVVVEKIIEQPPIQRVEVVKPVINNKKEKQIQFNTEVKPKDNNVGNFL